MIELLTGFFIGFVVHILLVSSQKRKDESYNKESKEIENQVIDFTELKEETKKKVNNLTYDLLFEREPKTKYEC